MVKKAQHIRYRISRRMAALGLGAVFLAALGYKAAYLSAEPGKDKHCGQLDPERAKADIKVSEQSPSLPWLQLGGTVNDASCVDETGIYGVIAPTTEKEVRDALAYARSHGLKVSIAGVKHSMGGHAFSKNNIVLDMRELSSIRVDNAKGTVMVGSGATWHDIQEVIHPKFAIQAMQSTDIFSVGGSVSVNAHGMDHAAGAVENSIVGMRVMLADGSTRYLSRTQNRELYELVVGGYGLFGIILDVELRLAANDLYESERRIISYKDFPAFYEEEIEGKSDIGLMYTHLSTAPFGGFLDEGIVYVYKKSPVQVPQSDIPALGEISSIPLRRFVMNLSKYGPVFQQLRWWTEKYIEPKMESCSISRNQAQGSGEACLVARNEPMHDSVKYLKNSMRGETDILHEYFIPRRNIVTFVDGMRAIMKEEDVNLLNASIRVVNRELGALSYAPEEAFSVVLYINQTTDEKGHAQMARVTQKLIDLTAREEGRFFLPYQLHYTKEQLRASYPNIDAFFAQKRAYDPSGLFTNTWYEKYAQP